MHRIVAATLLLISTVPNAGAAELFTPAEPIANRYIVVLDIRVLPGVAAPLVRTLAAELSKLHGGEVLHVYENVLGGFSVAIDAQGAAALAQNARVALVEQDSLRSIAETQRNAPWGLDRLDRPGTLDGSYSYVGKGEGVQVFVVDTGIRASHRDFGGRVAKGYSSIRDGRGTDDCQGHGTHVAGTIGGAQYGVAKGAILVPVRVLDCRGSGSTSGVIAGIDWVTSRRAKPSVANMSLGGGASRALDRAVQESIDAGVTYVVAAGNENRDACDGSPARVGPAVTVAASTRRDQRASFSNKGRCVDLFAPGDGIVSAGHKGDSASATMSGTSMAAPHVSGAAALILAGDKRASPSQVASALVNNAAVNRVTDAAGAPNRILQTRSGGEAPPPSQPLPEAGQPGGKGVVCDVLSVLGACP